MKTFVHKMTSQELFPFFLNSVNLLASSTNSGKTSFLVHIIKNRQSYFSSSVSGLLVVLCNPVVDGHLYKELESDDFPVDIVYLENFEPENIQENFVIIFEDVSILPQVILDTINVYTHHLNLNSVFIVCQSVFKDKFRELLSLVHNIIFSFNGANGVRLAKYINNYFCASDDLKKYMNEITNISSKLNCLVLLQLNAIARSDHAKFLAIVGIENLYTDKPFNFALVFPQLGSEDSFKKMSDGNETEVEDFEPETYPHNAFVLVPMKNVRKKSKANPITTEEEKWNFLNENLKEEIVNMFAQTKKQKPALLIASKMLKNKEFSFSKDGLQVMIKNKPSTLISTLDFLDLVSRPSFPNEPQKPKHAIFCLFVKKLMENGTPESIIRNKSLLLPSKQTVKMYKKMKFE